MLQFTISSPVQPSKAYLPINVTLSGMVMEVRLLQPEKADCPTESTLSGIVMEVRLLQFSYLQPVITQYFVRNKSEICHRPLRVHSKG